MNFSPKQRRPVVVAAVVRNHWPATYCYVKGLRNLRDTTISEVLFVDNGSTDGTPTQLRRLGYKVLHNPINAVGRARNIVFDYAGTADVLMVDGDHILTNGCVDVLQTLAYRYGLHIITPYSLYPNIPWLAEDAVFDTQFFEWYTVMRDDVLREHGETHKGMRRILQAVYPNGLAAGARAYVERHYQDPTVSAGKHWPGCVYHTRESIRRFGHYDPDYRGCGWEDTDYHRHVMLAGGSTAATQRAFVHHFCSLSLRALTLEAGLAEKVQVNETIYRRKYGL
jgi:glycosyltransferase involved in cell wall biosynthesis